MASRSTHHRLIALVVAVATVLQVSGWTPRTTAAQSAVPCTPESEPNDRAEEAPETSGEVCFSGALVEKQDQDLWFWTVQPEDGLSTWTFSMSGVPGATTSVHVIRITSPPGVFPATTAGDAARADSDPDREEPGILSDVQLPPGRYLLGVSRADPVADAVLTSDRGYHFSIARGLDLPPSADVEPNDDPAQARPVSGGFDISGDLRASVDDYRWRITDADASRSWRLEARTAFQAALTLSLLSNTGEQMAAGLLTGDGVARIHDLRLPAGEYVVAVGPAASAAQPYVLRAVEVIDALADAEPNDGRDRAVPIDPVTLATHGRLAAVQDRDDWSFDVDARLAVTLLDIELTWEGSRPFQLCLLRPAGPPVQCRDGNQGATLSDLLLPEGRYVLEVNGPPSLDQGYELRIVDAGAPTSDREREPNDQTGVATAWGAAIEMHGRLTGADDDLFRVTIAGEPQLWSVQATGTGIESVSWVASDGTPLGRATASPADGSATLSDLYLLPGDHTVRVRGRDGEYALVLTPQGGPDQDAELEPNDDITRAEPMIVDDHRTGRLANPGDIDIFRFSLATTDHVTIRVSPGTGGAVGMELWSGPMRLAVVPEPAPGQPMVYDARLYPGDYLVWLRPVVTSDADYDLGIERGDPFTTSADLEPNDTLHDARPMPRDLVVTGSGWGTRGEDDWYALPALPAGNPIDITVEGAVARIGLADGTSDLRLTGDIAAGTLTSPPLVADAQYWLRVTATGPYRVALSGDDLVPPPPVGVLDASLSFEPDVAEVAGYWLDAQQVAGQISISNPGTADQRLSLDATASAPDWVAELSQLDVQVPAGGTVSVPVTIHVPPDAPTDLPVRVTVRASDAQGHQVTAFAHLTPRADAAPVDPRRTWSVPPELLGGLDVASLAVGGVPVSPIDPVGEALLHDGRALAGSGFTAIFRNQPFTLTVDLAGDAAIPVAGFVLNPLAGDRSLASRARSVELQLSTDGVTWQTVHAGDLRPDQVDQPIVLDAPVPAAFARLVIHSSYSGTTGPVSLGEWKVVATPGLDPAVAARNIADPVRGGHVAWMSPQPEGIASVQGLLTEDPTLWAPIVTLRRQISWVVGFRDDRAGQVTELQWLDPPGSNPAIRSTSAEVEVTVGGPLGPWRSLGTWDLRRAPDGSVTPFLLDGPTWARFLRIGMAGPQQSTSRWELPSTLRVLERLTDDEYRSVVAEWGALSPDGIFEMLEPPIELRPDPDAPDPADAPAAATPLNAGQAAEGRVTRHTDVDWYSVVVPADQNVLSFQVVHSPGSGVGLSLEDEAGAPVRLFGLQSDDPAVTVWGARVVPGTYRVQVVQPVLSTAFTFDTSGSMAEFVPNVREALRAFVRDISPGDEAVKLFPFGEPPLNPDWADDPYLLEQLVNTAVVIGRSSAAELTMTPATKALGRRHGTRAMLVLTDAETTSYDESTALWEALTHARPVVFTIHVGGSGHPDLTTQLMQDWAMSSGGHYQYAATQSDIDQAFARMTTWLRRPAEYSMSWEATNTELPLAAIRVATPLGPTGIALPPPLGRDVGVALLLDTSGSMLERLGTSTRIGVAKDVLTSLVNKTLPEGIPVALRTFRAKKGSCGTTLVTDLEPLDRAAMTRTIAGLKLNKGTKTPIGATLRAVAGDLGTRPGPKVVVLVTDGKETCKGDPAAEVRRLRDLGLEATINIVGLALDDEELKASMQGWAELGGGTFFDAQDPDGLVAGIAAALRAPYRVYDEAGTIVATGIIGGPAVAVPTGVYRVEVLSEPSRVFEDIDLDPGETADLSLSDDEEP